MTESDLANAKPMTPAQESRFLELGERQNGKAPLYAAQTLDPTGVSRLGMHGRVDPDAVEMQTLLPAAMATNRKRAFEFCASNPKVAECQELKRLEGQSRSKGAQ